jgi:hypothetical protein
MARKYKLFVVIAVLGLCGAFSAQAASFTLNWPEQNGPGVSEGFPYVLDAGTQLFTIPLGETVIAAGFSSTLGNSEASSTAVMDVSVNGVLVGSCPNRSAPCWVGGGPYSFTHAYTSGELSSLNTGSANLTITQNDCCVIRLGASSLDITTGPGGSGIPEPSALALMGSGLISLALAARRRPKRP